MIYLFVMAASLSFGQWREPEIGALTAAHLPGVTVIYYQSGHQEWFEIQRIEDKGDGPITIEVNGYAVTLVQGGEVTRYRLSGRGMMVTEDAPEVLFRGEHILIRQDGGGWNVYLGMEFLFTVPK